MEIVAGALEWTQFDAEKWRSFIDTETGRRLIPKILENAPALLAAGETNAILIRSGELRGLQLAVNTLLDLSHPNEEEKPKVVDPYPALEDDAAWQDGQKLSEDPNPKSSNDIV